MSNPTTPRRKGEGAHRQYKGIFENGIWRCDCNPRLPADHRKTQKDAGNKGRWFYTCPKPQSKKCKFFLWEDDAKLREKGAVLSNSRNESASTSRNQQSLSFQKSPLSRGSLPSPPASRSKPGSSPSANKSQKRKVTLDDEDPFNGPRNGEENQQFTNALTKAETPEEHQTGSLLTIPKRRKLPFPHGGDMLGSAASGNSDVHLTPVQPETGDSERTPASISKNIPLDATPTPSRFRDVDTGDALKGLDSEILGALRQHNVRVTQDLDQALHDIIARHKLLVHGIARGRDISRLYFKAKDAKIAELQHSIARIEAERETDRAIADAMAQDDLT
ncbi:MAG: hypothetical protein M1820_002573 [Bogoriella megaspora]|nr:MAG: hypothetical protein M1820_002573 [Bogoriella megaspora]